MKPGMRYIVTKGSDDGTFEVGDHIWLDDDGGVCCIEAKGWIEAADVPAALVGLEYKHDQEYAQRQIAKALADAERIAKEYA